jgi:hypothetical protein
MFKNNKGSIEVVLIAFCAILAMGGLYYKSAQNDLITYNAGGEDGRLFGTTNYPTSLDSLTNPSATDSVATVSHSSQHANANDAIEALQAKLGIGASTATNNTVLYGNGTGSSAWSATPSLTSLVLSGQGQFGSFISNASSTIIGGLTITGNSTTTNATSTIGAFTGHATTSALYGAGLTTCVSNNFLTWTGGQFGCDTDDTGSLSITYASNVATSSTSANLALGPFNVTAGSTFIVLGKIGADGDGTATLSYKQGTETASTTLDETNHNAIGSGSDSPKSVSLQGVFIATTTTTVIFDIADTDPTASTWSSLIVLPI